MDQLDPGLLGNGSVKTTERYFFRYLTRDQQAIANADGSPGL